MAFSELAITSWDTTTEAGFEAVAAAIHDRLSAVGLVQTSDTGQYSAANTNTPTINTTVYEIWRFNDAAQSTDPIYFRVEFGWAANIARLRMSLIVGTGSNGAGTITNGHTIATNDYTASTLAGSPGRVAASFVNGSLALVVAATNSSGVPAGQQTTLMVVERLRDPETFALLPGVWYSVLNGGTGGLADFWLRRAGSWTTTNSCKAVPPSALASNRVMAGFYLPRLEPLAPLRAMLFLPTGTVGDNDTGTITIHGASANYKKLANPVADITVIIATSLLLCTD